MKHHRLKLLKVSAEMLVQIIGQRNYAEGYRLEAVGLPADAEIVNVRMGETFGFVYLVVASEEFPEVMPGAVMQRFEVTYTQVALAK